MHISSTFWPFIKLTFIIYKSFCWNYLFVVAHYLKKNILFVGLILCSRQYEKNQRCETTPKLMPLLRSPFEIDKSEGQFLEPTPQINLIIQIINLEFFLTCLPSQILTSAVPHSKSNINLSFQAVVETLKRRHQQGFAPNQDVDLVAIFPLILCICRNCSIIC